MKVHGKKIDCPVTATLELIGGRWKAPILYYLSKGTRRFGQIDATIAGISRKVLTEQLKELEKDGLIFREYYKEVPPRVEYSLTEFGQSLTQVFNSIVLWAEQNLIDSK
ncbi:transcriptional regulator [Flavobacterium sediminis]|jgi:DNA-binding HxlR family transcriptional regulator|uniref:Transcriptional regulator n=1 Tax=Flavobacterium sediminis TaxID=2201181 RepID=A0A2U8QWT3_9FLAO|nr:helix-turn-helix domain-containing protein [Flavobacterium sediminis]AWM14670.1 transcriptional regulator [Flavobacterium sediminis]